MSTETSTPAPAPILLLSQLNDENHLQNALSKIETEVRKHPTAAEHRWALAEMLCVLGQWERSLKQLQTAVQLIGPKDPQAAHWQSKAQLLRGLIRAQAQRSEVFAGQLLPVPVVDRPQWMEDLARAIALNAKGETAQADALRQSALNQAPTHAGLCVLHHRAGPTDAAASQADEARSEQTYAWLGDSDSRLGPVCEFIVAGGYRWVAYSDIAELHIERPQSLLDLVWIPAVLQLRHTQASGQRLHGFVPSRYYGTENVSAEIGTQQRDALLLGHLTRWQDVGETGVFAVGQKTLTTDQGDLPLLDIRSLRTHAPAAA